MNIFVLFTVLKGLSICLLLFGIFIIIEEENAIVGIPYIATSIASYLNCEIISKFFMYMEKITETITENSSKIDILNKISEQLNNTNNKLSKHLYTSSSSASTNSASTNSASTNFDSTNSTSLAINDFFGSIYISKLNLTIDIKEGISPEILANFAGHYPETSSNSGNIGIACFDTDISNKFEVLKTLVAGDEISLTTKTEKIIYKIFTMGLIHPNQLDVLNATDINTLTIISTNKQNMQSRVCIKAHEANRF